MGASCQELSTRAERLIRMRPESSIRRSCAAVLAAVLVLAACGSDAASISDTVVPQTIGGSEPSAEPLEPVDEEQLVIGSTLAAANDAPLDLVAQIIAEVFDNSTFDEDDVTVVSARSVVWNDGSLGCPQPGGIYTQALVEGYQVVLDTPDGQLDYHVGRSTYWVLCS